MIANRNYQSATREKLGSYIAIDFNSDLDHGQHVGAIELSSFEYMSRFVKLSVKNNMRVLAVCEKDSPGYLVVGNPGTKKQHETWLSTQLFDEIYKKVSSQYDAYYQC